MNNVIAFTPKPRIAEDETPEDELHSEIIALAFRMNDLAGEPTSASWLDAMKQDVWEMEQLLMRYGGGACGD